MGHPRIKEIILPAARLKGAAPTADAVNAPSTAFPWWGKAGHGLAEDHTALPVHLLAVAASFVAMLDMPGATEALSRAWGMSLKNFNCHVKPWLVLVAALHDLGKTLPGFQYKRPDVVALIERRAISVSAVSGFDHSVIGGMQLLPNLLKEMGGMNDCIAFLLDSGNDNTSVVRGLFHAAFAHHGYHPDAKSKTVKGLGGSRLSTAEWSAQKTALMGMVHRLVDVVQYRFGPLAVFPKPKSALACAHLFAGWVALADWMGSDAGQFPFIDCHRFGKDFPGSSEWSGLFAKHLETAHARVVSLGLHSPTKLENARQAIMGAYALRDTQEDTLLAAQWMAQSMAQSRGGLLIIEAPMGVGKTEAALLAATHFMSARQASGIAFALPAQASANMLFKRMMPLAQQVFGIREPNLSHGKANFAKKRLAYVGEEDGGAEASAHLDEWITDDNKKAFLAPLCAATVDQMELAAMHSKHGFVRYACLSRQVVVIDEVHAYDAYMQRILQSFLHLMGACGTPAVLLSATLPDAIRLSLMKAYADGAGWSMADAPAAPLQYPIVTAMAACATQAGAEVRHWHRTWSGDIKPVWFEMACDSGCTQVAIDMARAGHSVAILVNTVRSAKKRFKELNKLKTREDDIHLTILHSRFRVADRMSVQESIEQLLGKDSDREMRKGQIVVATQVLEQSIDIDVDVMFSEPAPIDLLLQRMGREQRHERSWRTLPARFLVIEPGDTNTKDAPRWWKATQRIYKESGKLLDSLQLVRSLAANGNPIELPVDIPALVRQIYGGAEGSRMTGQQAKSSHNGELVTLDDQADIWAIADDSVRSSQTRQSDEGGRALCVLFVEESRHDGSRSIPTPSGPQELPTVLDAEASHRVNPDFLEAAQPWLISLPFNGQEHKALERSVQRKHLSWDWRTGKSFDAASLDAPPFLLIPISRLRTSTGEGVSFEICPQLSYNSKTGIDHAQDD